MRPTRASRPLRVLVVVAALVLAAACGDDAGVDDGLPPIDESDTPAERTDAGVADQAPEDLGSDRAFCAFLTPDDISDATGLQVGEAVPGDARCTWHLGESAAVIDGPNEGGDASLEGAAIDAAAFDEFRDADDATVEPLDGVGDEAYLHGDADGSTAVLAVADDTSYFTLALTNALDGANATRAALTQLAAIVVAAN